MKELGGPLQQATKVGSLCPDLTSETLIASQGLASSKELRSKTLKHYRVGDNYTHLVMLGFLF